MITAKALHSEDAPINIVHSPREHEAKRRGRRPLATIAEKLPFHPSVRQSAKFRGREGFATKCKALRAELANCGSRKVWQFRPEHAPGVWCQLRENEFPGFRPIRPSARAAKANLVVLAYGKYLKELI